MPFNFLAAFRRISSSSKVTEASRCSGGFGTGRPRLGLLPARDRFFLREVDDLLGNLGRSRRDGRRRAVVVRAPLGDERRGCVGDGSRLVLADARQFLRHELDDVFDGHGQRVQSIEHGEAGSIGGAVEHIDEFDAVVHLLQVVEAVSIRIHQSHRCGGVSWQRFPCWFHASRARFCLRACAATCWTAL